MNILIKLSCIVALIIAPALAIKNNSTSMIKKDNAKTVQVKASGTNSKVSAVEYK